MNNTPRQPNLNMSRNVLYCYQSDKSDPQLNLILNCYSVMEDTGKIQDE